MTQHRTTAAALWQQTTPLPIGPSSPAVTVRLQRVTAASPSDVTQMLNANPFPPCARPAPRHSQRPPQGNGLGTIAQ